LKYREDATRKDESINVGGHKPSRLKALRITTRRIAKFYFFRFVYYTEGLNALSEIVYQFQQ